MRLKKGSTGNSVFFHFRQDPGGQSATGLVFNSAGAVASYTRTRGLRVDIPVKELPTPSPDDNHLAGGFIEIDGTNEKGVYRFDIPDAAVAASAGVNQVLIHMGFDGVFEESLLIELVDYEINDIPKLVWDYATSLLVTADSIGKYFMDNLNAAISSIAATVWAAGSRTLTAGTRGDAEIDALIIAVASINAKTTNLPTDPASETNVSANGTKLDALATDLTRLLGLNHENFYLDQITYTSGKMATLRKRLYSDAASVGTDNNVIATYNVTVTFASGLVDTYKEVKV